MLRSLLLPPGGPLLVGFAGLLLWRRRPRIGLALCAASILGLWILSTPLVADALGRAAEGYPAIPPSALPALRNQAGAIVVLGGGFRLNVPEAGGNEPSLAADMRLVEGARVARATDLPVLITGNSVEAAAMRRFMQDSLGVPVRWLEDRSLDTRDNARFSARILKPIGIDRIILVTSGTHMIRAVADFKAVGFAVVPAPGDTVTRDEVGILSLIPTADALSRSQVALYEFAGRFVHLFI